MRIYLSRRSQIPSTIAWFVAFLVIFFIMMIFIALSIVIAAKKSVSLVGDKLELELNSQEGNLPTMKQVVSYIETSGFKSDEELKTRINVLGILFQMQDNNLKLKKLVIKLGGKS